MQSASQAIGRLNVSAAVNLLSKLYPSDLILCFPELLGVNFANTKTLVSKTQAINNPTKPCKPPGKPTKLRLVTDVRNQEASFL